MGFLIEIVRLGLNNLWLHKTRSVLTALGIILGVAAVITMVSLGEGSKREALLQIERLGARNIIVRSQRPAESGSQQGGQQRGFILTYGITREDYTVVEANFPYAEHIIPLKEVGSQILREDKRQSSQTYGTIPQLKQAANLRVARGRYLSDADMDNNAKVCVIGQEVAKELFPFDNPIGETIRVDQTALEVVGVLSPVGLSGGAGAALVGRDLNKDVHIPITTAKAVFGDQFFRRESGSFQGSNVEISELFVASPTRDMVRDDAAKLRRIFDARHPGLPDIGLIVPYELLEQARKSALTWNLVLGAIASISLLVGGIGIMNIMLATVTERTREIGIRRAIGATREHIVWQFLVETGALSALGGIIGVGLGLGGSLLIGWGAPMLPDLPYIGQFFPPDISMPTHPTAWSVGVAFAVATMTGLVFGIYPALKASQQDPIVALRHD
ncbi:MAG: ABC transporter permease [Planctomycetota bacterium]